MTTSEALPIVSSEMKGAIHRQIAEREKSILVDRRGWTQKQWVDDARELMGHPDGAITSLVNGHISAMLDEIDKLNEQLALVIRAAT